MFFITCFQHIRKEPKKFLDIGDSRVFGYFSSLEQAKNALAKNTLDMHEDYYNYAMIEEIGEGIHPEVESRHFFEYDSEIGGFIPIEEPIAFKHYTNFALG